MVACQSQMWENKHSEVFLLLSKDQGVSSPQSCNFISVLLFYEIVRIIISATEASVSVWWLELVKYVQNIVETIEMGLCMKFHVTFTEQPAAWCSSQLLALLPELVMRPAVCRHLEGLKCDLYEDGPTGSVDQCTTLLHHPITHALLLLNDYLSLSVWLIKKNVWQLSHIIREGEPDVWRVCDWKLMRFPWMPHQFGHSGAQCPHWGSSTVKCVIQACMANYGAHDEPCRARSFHNIQPTFLLEQDVQ